MRMDKLTVKAQEALAAPRRRPREPGHAQVEPLHLLDAAAQQEGGLCGPLLEKVGMPRRPRPLGDRSASWRACPASRRRRAWAWTPP